MAVRKGRLAIRGPSSPELGQDRPTDRLRPSVIIDLGIRDDGHTGTTGTRTPVVAKQTAVMGNATPAVPAGPTGARAPRPT